MDQEKLKAEIKLIADKYWAENNKPILLSELGPQLANLVGEDGYRTQFEGKSLKTFIKDTGEANGYRLVVHPTQSAKIGLVPLDSTFEFESVNPSAEKSPEKSDRVRKQENKALALLEILATLPDAELAQISIPISALVKLIK